MCERTGYAAVLHPSLTSLPSSQPSICRPRTRPGPGRERRSARGWIAKLQTEEIHGSNYKKGWTGRENKPFLKGAATKKDWPRGGTGQGGLAQGRCQLLSRRTGQGDTGRQGHSMRLSLGPGTLTQTFTCRDIPKEALLLPGQARMCARRATPYHEFPTF